MNNNIQAALVEVARNFIVLMSAKVSQQRLPQKIVNATSVGTPQLEDGGGSIQISIDLSENGAPMAAAFEWGSGIHATRGTAQKYPIVPRNARILAIPRSRWPNYVPPPDVDPVFLPKVMHPGVAPRPYIRPALEDNREFTKKKLGSSFNESVILRGTTVYTVKIR